MIKIQNLAFSYGDKVIFDGLNVEFSDGITCIRGESGRGKTTLLRIIAGLEKNYTGTVSGVPERISFLFQEDRLLPWLTVRQNLELVNDGKCRYSSEEILDLMELSDYADKKPHELSGGQQRRVSLGRAILYSPSLLLLDEPFKGFDPALTERMASVVRSLGIPTIAIVHAESDAMLLSDLSFSL